MQLAHAQSTFYIPSGKAPLGSVLLLVVCSIIAAVVIGVIYELIVGVVPFLLIAAGAVAGAGMSIGVVTAWITKKGHIRSRIVTLFCALVAALVCLGTAWLTCLLTRVYEFPLDQIPEAVKTLISQPADIWALMQQVNEHGLWSLEGANVTGSLLSIIWLAEAGIVIFFSLALANSAFDTPYSESSHCWMTDDKLPAAILDCPKAEQEMLEQELKSGNLNKLLQLTLSPDSTPELSQAEYVSLTLTFFNAAQDPDIFMTVKAIIPGKKETKVKEIIKNLRIDATTQKKLADKNTNVM